MNQAIMKRRADTHKKKSGIVQKTVLPTLCFAALSTIAFEKEVLADQNNLTQVQIASEGTQKYVNIDSGTLNLRESASTKSTIIATLSKGTAVTVYTESNGWAKVKAGGKDGYVSTIYLSATIPISNTKTNSSVTTTTKYVNVNSGTLNLRVNASTGSAVIQALTNGTVVTVYSETNGWAKVKVNGKDGFVSSLFLSASKPNSSGNTQSPVLTPIAAPAAATVTKYVNVNSGSTLNMRNSASTSASIIVKLAKGAEVKVDSEAGGWSKIEAFGQTGYVSTEFLSDTIQGSTTATTPVQQNVTMYVNVNGGSSLNLRVNGTVSSTVLAKIQNGTKVQVISISNGWAKVQVNNQEGYVSTDFLSETSPNTTANEVQTDSKKYVNVNQGSSLNMRKSPSANSSIIIKIARGVEVTVYTESNGWSEIEAYGQTGYVSSDFLSLTNPLAGTDLSADNSNSGPTQTTTENTGTDPTAGNSSDSTSSTSVLKYVNVIYGSSLNLRSSSSTNSSVLTKLARGTVVNVISEDGGWAKVTVNGKVGYVSSQYLSVAEPFNPNQNSSTTETDYESYGVSLSEMTNIQMAVIPQTDKKYDTFIRADALSLTAPNSGIVGGDKWNVRGGAGTGFWVVGQVSNSDTVQVLAKVKGTDGNDWYQINYDKTWVNASPDDVAYYINPNNFVNNPVDSMQFLKLSVSTNIDSTEVNSRILNGKGILQGQAAAFINAGNTYGINEIYLISHALLETGNGTSQLANGVVINGKTVYNMYGIGAIDDSPVNSGAQFAYNAGWFTPEEAIIGGARFIADGYIDKGQDTLYKMRWNPIAVVTNGLASHQYASDIGWADKQVTQIYNLYQLLDSYKLVMDIPKYM